MDKQIKAERDALNWEKEEFGKEMNAQPDLKAAMERIRAVKKIMEDKPGDKYDYDWKKIISQQRWWLKNKKMQW